jgi:hypothetical protein
VKEVKNNYSSVSSQLDNSNAPRPGPLGGGATAKGTQQLQAIGSKVRSQSNLGKPKAVNSVAIQKFPKDKNNRIPKN